MHISQHCPSPGAPPLESVDVRQIYDKFPEKKGGLRELYDRGPPHAFFLVKFWVSPATKTQALINHVASQPKPLALRETVSGPARSAWALPLPLARGIGFLGNKDHRGLLFPGWDAGDWCRHRLGIGLGPPQPPLDVATPRHVTDTVLGIGVCRFRLPFVPPDHTKPCCYRMVPLPLSKWSPGEFGF